MMIVKMIGYRDSDKIILIIVILVKKLIYDK